VSTQNPYLNPGMPLSRVRLDALHGVKLAREAWRVRDPEGVARELGRIVEPSSATSGADERRDRVLQATRDFFAAAGKGRRSGGRRTPREAIFGKAGGKAHEVGS